MSYEGDLATYYNTIHKRLVGNPRNGLSHNTPNIPSPLDKNSQVALLLRIDAIEEAIKRLNRFMIEGERLEDERNPHKTQIKTFPVEKIVEIVCAEEGLSRAEIASKQRKTPLVTARHLIFYLCSRWTMRTLGEIGRKVGVQDHTTVMHGIRKMMLRRTADADLDIKISKYEEKLKQLVNVGDNLPSISPVHLEEV